MSEQLDFITIHFCFLVIEITVLDKYVTNITENKENTSILSNKL